MENNQCENIPPMLPINSCGGELPRIQDLKELDITNKNCIMIKKQDLNQSIKSQSLQSLLINKDLIIQDLKDVIVDLKKKNQKLELDYIVSKTMSITYNNRQSEIIKELQLENKEVNKQSKFFENAYYACCGVILVLLTAIYYIK